MVDTIQQIVKNLKAYNPQKIILFGSYARGKERKNSDYDILIIKETRQKQYSRIPKAKACLRNMDKAFDILVMTPKEIAKRLKLGDFFIEEILRKGKVLYEEK